MIMDLTPNEIGALSAMLTVFSAELEAGNLKELEDIFERQGFPLLESVVSLTHKVRDLGNA